MNGLRWYNPAYGYSIAKGECVKRRMFALTLVAALASVPVLSAQSAVTEQSLKTAHEALMAALKSGNLAMAQGLIHPRALGFYKDSQMLVQLRSDYRAADALPAVLADLGRFAIVAYDTSYRAIGNTGVVCMATNMQANRGEKAKDRFIRSTYVYVNADGNWRLLSWHSSDIPLKK